MRALKITWKRNGGHAIIGSNGVAYTWLLQMVVQGMCSGDDGFLSDVASVEPIEITNGEPFQEFAEARDIAEEGSK